MKKICSHAGSMPIISKHCVCSVDIKITDSEAVFSQALMDMFSKGADVPLCSFNPNARDTLGINIYIKPIHDLACWLLRRRIKVDNAMKTHGS